MTEAELDKTKVTKASMDDMKGSNAKADGTEVMEVTEVATDKTKASMDDMKGTKAKADGTGDCRPGVQSTFMNFCIVVVLTKF